eukprot:6478481-Amphidinium_carterae.1
MATARCDDMVLFLLFLGKTVVVVSFFLQARAQPKTDGLRAQWLHSLDVRRAWLRTVASISWALATLLLAVLAAGHPACGLELSNMVILSTTEDGHRVAAYWICSSSGSIYK